MSVVHGSVEGAQYTGWKVTPVCFLTVLTGWPRATTVVPLVAFVPASHPCLVQPPFPQYFVPLAWPAWEDKSRTVTLVSNVSKPSQQQQQLQRWR